MKKVILVLLLLLCTGCWDYNELNNLAIVSGIAIDYKDDEYAVTYEILNDKKVSQGENGSNSKVHLVEGQGKTIFEAFQNADLNVSKNAYFSHMKVIILSEEVAKNHIKGIVDYLLRNPYMDTSTYTVVANGTDASDIIDSATDADPVTSEMIYNMLQNNIHNKNIGTYQTFEENFSDMTGKGKDVIMPSISKEDDKLALDTLSLFHHFSFVNYLNEQDSMTYQLFSKNASNAVYEKVCDENKKTIIGIYKSNPKIEIEDNKVKIKLNLEATINENGCEKNLNHPEAYLKLQDEFNQIIKEKVDTFLLTLQENNSDILGFGQMYYHKYRKKDEEIWKSFEFDTEVHVEINKKGLIFEVKDND